MLLYNITGVVDSEEQDPLGDGAEVEEPFEKTSWRLMTPTYYVDWLKPAPYSRASPGFFANAYAPKKGEPAGFCEAFDWDVVESTQVESWDSVEIPLVQVEKNFDKNFRFYYLFNFFVHDRVKAANQPLAF